MAFERSLISAEQLKNALYQLDNLLTYLYKDKFDHLQAVLENLGV